jgi:uncharacterized protein YndB with AHSA1/START domain
MTPDLTTSVRIEATPEEVFPYLIDPALLIEWIGDWADLKPEPGGIFAVNINGVAARGTYVLFEPPHRVVFTWGVPGHETLPPGSSTVTIRLVADGDDTMVELTHAGLPEDAKPGHLEGWVRCLGQLAAAAAGLPR